MAILTVYTKLLDKTLEGARIIDMGATKSCECYVLPREQVAEVGRKQERLHQYGFYILLGRHAKGQPMAYIGQTNDFVTRAIDHKQKKEFWDTALVFVSKSNEIFSSEVLYLEYLGWKAATEVDNYLIENTKDLNKPHLSDDKKNEMELFFEDIQFLTRFYGCRVFDRPERPVEQEQPIRFTLTMAKYGLESHLLFYRESKRYVIEAGSTILAQTWESCPKSVAKFRMQVLETKKLAQREGDLCKLLQDIDLTDISSSPSGTASFCTGTSYQGTTAWADAEGKKYPSEWWKE